MISKGVLSYLMSIGSKNNYVSKMFKVAINLVMRCFRYRGFTDARRELESVSSITSFSQKHWLMLYHRPSLKERDKIQASEIEFNASKS